MKKTNYPEIVVSENHNYENYNSENQMIFLSKLNECIDKIYPKSNVFFRENIRKILEDYLTK